MPRNLVLPLASFLLALPYLTKIRSADFWWHLATGRWIVEHHSIPRVDPFSFTAGGEPWTNVNWLGDLLLYAAYTLGGFAGVVWLKALLCFTTLTLSSMVLKRAGATLGVTLVVLLAVATLLQDRYTLARPSAFSAPFAAAAMVICTSLLRRPALGAMGLVGLTGVWMQTHASALLMLPLALGVAAQQFLPRSVRGSSVSDRARWSTVGAFVVIAVLFVGTQRGQEILTHASGYASSTLVVQLTQEWLPIDWTEKTTWLAAALHGIGLYFAASSWWRARGIEARGACELSLLIVGFSLLGAIVGLRAERHLGLGLLLSSPSWGVGLTRLRQVLAERNSSFGWKALVVSSPLLIPGLLVVALGWPIRSNWGLTVEDNKFHPDTLDVLRGLPTGFALNSFGLGGYLIWERIPGGVYMDGRTVQVYDEAFLKDSVLPLATDRAAFDAKMDEYDITYGLIGGHAFDARAVMGHPAWFPIYFGKASTLFVRESKVASIARPLEERRLTPYRHIRYIHDEQWLANHYRPILADAGLRQELGNELVRAHMTHPGYVVLATTQYLEAVAPGFSQALSGALQAAQQAPQR